MMNEVFEKIIEKLNKKKVYFQGFYECEGKAEHDSDLNKVTQLAFDEAIEIVKQAAENYNKELMAELIEAKKKCGEDSDCSECIFGQEEDRCYLQDLQIFNNDLVEERLCWK